MAGQMSWIILGVFIAGIFIGSNLGIMLMVLMLMAKRADVSMEDLAMTTVQSEGLESPL